MPQWLTGATGNAIRADEVHGFRIVEGCQMTHKTHPGVTFFMNYQDYSMRRNANPDMQSQYDMKPMFAVVAMFPFGQIHQEMAVFASKADANAEVKRLVGLLGGEIT